MAVLSWLHQVLPTSKRKLLPVNGSLGSPANECHEKNAATLQREFHSVAGNADAGGERQLQLGVGEFVAEMG